MATYNRKKRCFVTAAGKPMRGVHKFITAKPSFDSKSQKSVGFALGRKLDDDLTHAITSNSLPTTPRGQAIFDLLKSMALVPVAAQVPVANIQRNLATAIDIVAHTPSKTPVVIEIKYCGPHSSTIDSLSVPYVPPTFFSHHQRRHIPNTRLNQYLEQLHINMELHARTTKTPKNTPLVGYLFIACFDKVVSYHATFPYIPATGVNTPAAEPSKKKQNQPQKRKRKPASQPKKKKPCL